MPCHLPWHYLVNPVITSEDFLLCISGRNLRGKIHARSCSGSSANPSKVWLHPDPPFPRNSPLQELVSLGLPIPPGGYFTSKPTPKAGQGRAPILSPMPEVQHREHHGGGRCCGGTVLLVFCILDVSIRGWCQDVGAAQSPAATQEELEQGLEPPGICRQIPTAISPDKPVLLVACKLPCGSSQKLWRPIRHQAGIWPSAHPARTLVSSTEELRGQTMVPKPPAQPIATHITGKSAARAKHIGIL